MVKAKKPVEVKLDWATIYLQDDGSITICTNLGSPATVETSEKNPGTWFRIAKKKRKMTDEEAEKFWEAPPK
jgi:hypothetical protein